MSCFGGFIWYKRKTKDSKIIKSLPLKLSDKITNNFFLINTGKPKESTGEMVSLVKKFVEENPVVAERILNNQEILTKFFLSALKNNNEREIIETIKKGERNLEKLGAVSEFAKKIIREIEQSGGAAKICGAGGKTKGAGIILVYHSDSSILKNLLKSYSLSYLKVFFGEEGVRIDKF